MEEDGDNLCYGLANLQTCRACRIQVKSLDETRHLKLYVVRKTNRANDVSTIFCKFNVLMPKESKRCALIGYGHFVTKVVEIEIHRITVRIVKRSDCKC